jgi:hypothetical protein
LTICWKCVDTGKVLGKDVYNYEPCPLCHPEDYEEFKRLEALKKKKDAK